MVLFDNYQLVRVLCRVASKQTGCSLHQPSLQRSDCYTSKTILL